MFQEAVRARLPLIAARTRDPSHVEQVINHLARRPVHHLSTLTKKSGLATEALYYWVDLPAAISGQVDEVYQDLEDKGSTLVLVNPEEVPASAFDGGELPVPPKLLRQVLVDADFDAAQVEACLPAMAGLVVKEVKEVARLCQALYGSLEPGYVLDVRRRAFSQVRGIQAVDTRLGPYRPEALVDDYLDEVGPFLAHEDGRLQPRGLLLDGPPGVGKSTAAKHAARMLGVQLFRFDLGAIKGRYVGESEHALQDALSQVDREAPCVLLIDEVEKLFHRERDEGVSEGLLADVLWWLAEHAAPVLTFMTTNDSKRIPAELVRPGRLDARVELRGLDPHAEAGFRSWLADLFRIKYGLSMGEVSARASGGPDIGTQAAPRWSQALVEARVKSAVRQLLNGDD